MSNSQGVFPFPCVSDCDAGAAGGEGGVMYTISLLFHAFHLLKIGSLQRIQLGLKSVLQLTLAQTVLAGSSKSMLLCCIKTLLVTCKCPSSARKCVKEVPVNSWHMEIYLFTARMALVLYI